MTHQSEGFYRHPHFTRMLAAALAVALMQGCISTDVKQARAYRSSGLAAMAMADRSREAAKDAIDTEELEAFEANALAHEQKALAMYQQAWDAYNREGSMTEAPQIKSELTEVGAILAQPIIKDAADAISRHQRPDVYTFQTALDILDAASAYDMEGTILPPLQRQYQRELEHLQTRLDAFCSAYKEELRENNLSRGELDKVLEEIRQIDVSSTQLDALEQAWALSNVRHVDALARAELQAGKIGHARAYLTELTDYPLEPETRSQIVEDLQRTMLARARQLSKTALVEKEYCTAYRALEQALSGVERESVERVLEELRPIGVQHYLGRAQEAKEGAGYGRAYLETMKGLYIDPDDAELLTMHHQLRALFLENSGRGSDTIFDVPPLRETVQVRAIPSRSINDVSQQFLNELIPALKNSLPQRIFQVQRIDAGSTDLLQQENRIDISATIEVETTDDKVEIIEEWSTTVLEENDLWQDLSPKQREKREVSQWLERETTEVQPYTKGIKRIKGILRGSLNLEAKGDNDRATTIRDEYEKSSEYNDGVPQAGIEEVIPNLPSASDVKQELIDSGVAEVIEITLGVFRNWARQNLEAARMRKDLGEIHETFNELARGHLYCVEAAVPSDDRLFLDLWEMILTETESPMEMPAATAQSH